MPFVEEFTVFDVVWPYMKTRRRHVTPGRYPRLEIFTSPVSGLAESIMRR